MKVSDRNEVVIEGVVRRNRSLSGDAAAELDVQIQTRRRRSRGSKAKWQHNRFDVRMPGPKGKANRPRVRRGCIVRVSGQLRSTDGPDPKTYIEAKDIDVLRQPASKRPGSCKRRKPKGGDDGRVTVAEPAEGHTAESAAEREAVVESPVEGEAHQPPAGAEPTVTQPADAASPSTELVVAKTSA